MCQDVFSMIFSSKIFVFFVLLVLPLRYTVQDEYEELRMEMVEKQIRNRGVNDPEVLNAMRAVPRHLFVPDHQKSHAYEDRPLSIGNNQTHNLALYQLNYIHHAKTRTVPNRPTRVNRGSSGGNYAPCSIPTRIGIRQEE